MAVRCRRNGRTMLFSTSGSYPATGPSFLLGVFMEKDVETPKLLFELQDYIGWITDLVERYGVELDVYAWNILRNKLIDGT